MLIVNFYDKRWYLQQKIYPIKMADITRSKSCKGILQLCVMLKRVIFVKTWELKYDVVD